MFYKTEMHVIGYVCQFCKQSYLDSEYHIDMVDLCPLCDECFESTNELIYKYEGKAEFDRLFAKYGRKAQWDCNEDQLIFKYEDIYV